MNIPVVPQAGLPTYRPSPAETRYIDDAIAYLNMTTPFWGSALYSAMKVVHSHAVPYAGTDSHLIYVNVPAMMKAGWGFEEVAFVLAHEVLHYLYGDLVMATYWRGDSTIILPDGTTLPYEHGLMNKALDYRINPALIDGKVGKFPKIGLFDRTLSAKGMEDCIEIYAKLWKKRQEQGGGSGDEEGFDVHLAPSSQAVEEDKASGVLRRAQVIATAKMVAEAAGMGSLPAAVAALIGEILEPKVKWQDHLRASMMRASGIPRHDWSKVNKRLISRPDNKIIFARRGSYGCGTVVVGYDTSGSCANPATQQRFFSEMNNIVADLNPAQLIVIWCDAKVQRVDDLEEPSDLEALRCEINEAGGAPGGGGTDLRKIFEHIHEEHIEPDMLVVLTDMLTPFPAEPDYPVIWCSILPNKAAPFGELVECGE